MQQPGDELRRNLGRIDVLALTVNVIVGAGVFAMPSAIAATAGRYSLAVLLTAFCIVALLALCLVEVASRYDATGGPPLYAAEAFGPLVGFAVGWLLALSRVAAFAAIAAIMLDYAAALAPVLEARPARRHPGRSGDRRHALCAAHAGVFRHRAGTREFYTAARRRGGGARRACGRHLYRCGRGLLECGRPRGRRARRSPGPTPGNAATGIPHHLCRVIRCEHRGSGAQ